MLYDISLYLNCIINVFDYWYVVLERYNEFYLKVFNVSICICIKFVIYKEEKLMWDIN